MEIFFFYKYLTDENLINKINNNYEIQDGYVIINKNENETDCNNCTLLYGKIVFFNMTIDNILKKINTIEECKRGSNNRKYTIERITAYTNSGNSYEVNYLHNI